VCVLRLPPGEYALKLTFNALFPKPEEDPAYRLMLDFADRPAYQAFGSGKVNRFRQTAS